MTRLRQAPLRAGARVLGFGSSQPQRVVTNDELAERVDTNDEWIRERVGIVSRRIADPETKLVEIAADAGSKAVADSGLSPADVDTIIVRAGLSAHGTRVHAAHLDVRDSDITNRFAADAQAAIGPADILVNAAGTTAEQPVCGHSDALWDKIVDTNLSGAFRATRAVLPGMIERGWGRIVNIGSTAATVGWKDNPAY